MGFRPFREGDTLGTFLALVENTVQEIMALQNEYVMKASQAELEDYFIGRVTISPLVLRANEYHIEKHEGTKVNVTGDFRRATFRGEDAFVRGTKIDIGIPFEGDPHLFRVSASTFSMSPYPEITIKGDVVVFSVIFPDDSADPKRLRKEIDQQVALLRKAVEYIQRDIENHNATAPQRIRSAITAKRGLASSATGAVAALGIPIKQRDQPPTFTIPTRRRPSPVNRPKVPTAPYQPEPVLAEAEYQHILSVMRSMSVVIERSPAAFSSLDEEAIRTHFLLQLNGHYEGGATGETFNAAGKTDILIKVGDRNVFIAECKFWRGPKGFNDAIDQLMRYLSWRDTKCALLIFNRTKNSSDVRQKIHEAMQARPEHRRTVAHDSNGDSRYIFVKETDPGKEITITTQLYDVPVDGT
jgi:hypothetical protein